MSERCKVTGVEFEPSPAERALYERFQIPIPDLITEERIRRKLAFVNEQRFFWQKGEGEQFLSTFYSVAPFPVLPPAEFLQWDGTAIGSEYQVRAPFFEQLHELFARAPRPALLGTGDTDSGIHFALSVADSSMILDSASVRHSAYCVGSSHLDRCFDNLLVGYSTLTYGSLDCVECSELLFSEHCSRVKRGAFLFNCVDCEDCFLSSNLVGARYVFQNKKLSAEEYRQKRSEWDLSIRHHLERAQEEFGLLRQKSPIPELYADFGASTAVRSATGNYLRRCDRCEWAFESEGCVDSAILVRVRGAKNSIDLAYCFGPLEECAQCVNLIGPAIRVTNSFACGPEISDIAYCAYCSESSHLFGCIGLTGKSYCIFNRQYSKEEYFSTLHGIHEVLKRKRVYGKFFPPAFSDYPYNHSAAMLMTPINSYQSELLGFRWDDKDETISPSKLLSGIQGAPGEFFSELPTTLEELTEPGIFLCEISGNPFALTSEDIALHRALQVFPPARSFEQRHREKLHRLSPRKLQSRGGRFTAFGNETKSEVLPRVEWFRRFGGS